MVFTVLIYGLVISVIVSGEMGSVQHVGSWRIVSIYVDWFLWCLYWILKLIYICNNLINGCGIPSKLYGWSILRLSSLLIRKNPHPKRLHCLHFPLAITYRLTTKTILIIIDALNLALNYYIIIFPHKTRNPISFGINVCRGFVSNISFK